MIWDRRWGCLLYGEPNRWSWGWVVDDFGNAVIPQYVCPNLGAYMDQFNPY